MDMPTPMEIEATRKWGPLSTEEKQRRRANLLCLYCRGPGHIAINRHNRPQCQVNQIITKPESIPVRISENNLNSPIQLPNREDNSSSLSNRFEVLSQLEDELNE
jgi:hypothetical protein